VDVQGGLVLAVQQTITLVETVDAPVLANVDEVETGSTVNAFYLNVQVAASSTAALANMYMAVVKNRGNNEIFPNINVLGLSDTKRNVIHEEMIMTEKNTTAIPRTLFKGVIMIPRGMRRNAPDDEFQLLLFSPGVNVDFCVQCIYKEYR